MSKPSIGLFGNTCNILYQLALALRKSEKFDVHLYIDLNSDLQQLPESDDQSLLERYPEWIHKGNYVTAKTVLFPWTSPLVCELQKHDLSIVSHFGPMFSQFTGKHTIFLPAGGDLTIHPFALSFLFLYYPSLKEKLGALFVGYWQRKGLRRCSSLWIAPFPPFLEATRKLNLPTEQIVPVRSTLVMDTQKFNRIEPGQIRNQTIRELRARFDFLIFHPSRLMMNRNPKFIATGNWKQNDLLIKAYAHFLRANPQSRSALVLIDRPASTARVEARTLISELGIAEQVIWLKPPREFGFTREELIEIYSLSDVVADDFGVGWFGSIVLEALAVGCNVLCYVREDVMKLLYPWHPILSANTEEGISEIFTRLYRDQTFRREQGILGRQWVEEFHAERCVQEQFVNRIERVLDTL